jgi:hypothetical protein
VGTAATFQLCVTTTPTVPANDDPCRASRRSPAPIPSTRKMCGLPSRQRQPRPC